MIKRIRIIRDIIGFSINQNAFVFGAPYHGNAGDQAQTYCIQQWISQYYPGYKIRVYDSRILSRNSFELMKRIGKCIKPNDLLFLHSGYHTTDLYMLEENMQRMSIQLFPKHQIVMLPQTVYYKKAEEAENAKRIYNAHHHLLMMCRDEISYEIAGKLFENCKRLLFPDIVTCMIGQRRYKRKREGIMLCVRDDKESLLSPEAKDNLVNALEAVDHVDLTDTTLPYSGEEFNRRRKEILEQEWEKYAQYRLVVTDRFHGTIFSLIAGTPVIVMPSTDHKLSSGVKWFPESYKDYVHYSNNIHGIPEIAKTIYEREYDYTLEPYFSNHYYSRLRTIIEEAL